MKWTRSELDQWHGRELLDAEAEPVGHIATTFVDKSSGTPRWLGVLTAAHGDDVTPVPVEGAEPTGRAIRVPHLAATIRAAAHVAPDADLTREQERQLAVYYALEEPAPPRPQAPDRGPGVDRRIVKALRDAHALEREAHSRLESLISSLDDPELQHDAARHLTETEGHTAAIAGRLEQLETAPSTLHDFLVRARSPNLPSGTAALLRDALDFERRECGSYDELIATARSAGDEATAEIARKIRADEEAMAETIASALRRMGQPV